MFVGPSSSGGGSGSYLPLAGGQLSGELSVLESNVKSLIGSNPEGVEIGAYSVDNGSFFGNLGAFSACYLDSNFGANVGVFAIKSDDGGGGIYDMFLGHMSTGVPAGQEKAFGFNINYPQALYRVYFEDVLASGDKVIRFKAQSGNVLVATTTSYANDAAAAGGGVPVGGAYNSSGTLKIRLV
jgi:hypothetical protein